MHCERAWSEKTLLMYFARLEMNDNDANDLMAKLVLLEFLRHFKDLIQKLIRSQM